MKFQKLRTYSFFTIMSLMSFYAAAQASFADWA